MDQRALFRTMLLALEETVRALAAKGKQPSTGLVDQINTVLIEINEMVPGSHFVKLGYFHDLVEVLGQIKLALSIVGQDSRPSIEESAPAAEDQAPQPGSHRAPRPEIFIGCSVEGLTEAKIIQMELAHSANTVIWSQGVFGLSRGTLETLVEKAPSFTHAILVLTPDDMLTKRANEAPAARDNVLFELGLFMGALGRERTFVVAEKSVQLPSDLAGIATVSFQRGEGINVVANLGPVVTKLQLEMGLL
jgi:predicted nucleotide-binding protein